MPAPLEGVAESEPHRTACARAVLVVRDDRLTSCGHQDHGYDAIALTRREFEGTLWPLVQVEDAYRLAGTPSCPPFLAGSIRTAAFFAACLVFPQGLHAETAIMIVESATR